MTLKEHINHILKLMDEGENVPYTVLDEAIYHYTTALNRCTSVADIQQVLEEDRELCFPVTVRLETYRRLVDLERTPENLRLLAHYLYFHGPDWDDEAAELYREAAKREKR